MTSTGTVFIGNLGTSTIRKIKIVGQNINPVVNSNECNIFTTSTADTNFGGTGTIFVGRNKTSGFIAMGGGCETIMNGQLTCNSNIGLGNSTSTQIYANSGTGSFTLRSDNTMNCIGAGVSKFGSWNNGNVELGTQSYSNVIIGAGGSGSNARTTTIKGSISVTGNGGSATNLWGVSRYVNFAASNTITPPIDIIYFVTDSNLIHSLRQYCILYLL